MDQDDNPQSTYAAPNELKKLRACKRCHLVKTEKQFRKDGCDNCPYFKENRYTVFEYTTSNFEGMTCIMDPETSWVSKYLNVKYFVPGTYAITVRSHISDEQMEVFEANGLPLARNPII